MTRTTSTIALLIALAAAPATTLAAPVLGFDAGDRICRKNGGGFQLQWTETRFSRNQAQGADGRCRTVPGYVTRLSTNLRSAAYFQRTLGFPRPPRAGRQAVQVLDVRGPTGFYGWTIGYADGTSAVAIDTYLLPVELRTIAAHEHFHLVQNGLVHDLFARAPQWLSEGTANWAEVRQHPDAVVDVTSQFGQLGGGHSRDPVTKRAYAAVAFWKVVADGPSGPAIIRDTLAAVGARRGKASTRRVVSALRSASAGTLADVMGRYAVALLGGSSVGGLPLPAGFHVAREAQLTTPRTVALEPLQARFVPIAAGVGSIVTVTAADADAAADLARSCTLVPVGGSPVVGTAAGAVVTWTLPPTNATLVLTSALSRAISIDLATG